MSFSETISPFFGRVALTWFFLVVIGDLLGNFHEMNLLLTSKQVPLAPLVIVVALVLLVIGCFSLLFGYHAKHGAVLLFGLTVVSAVVLHDFWHIPAGPTRSVEFDIFARDMAVCGGLLLMVGLGAGPFAIDNRPKGGGGKKH